MVIVMDMETGRVEAAVQAASECREDVAYANWVDLPRVLQHQAMPRLAERVAEPDADLLQRAYRAQRC